MTLEDYFFFKVKDQSASVVLCCVSMSGFLYKKKKLNLPSILALCQIRALCKLMGLRIKKQGRIF